MFLKYSIVEHFAPSKNFDYVGKFIVIYENLSNAIKRNNIQLILQFYLIYVYVFLNSIFLLFLFYNDFDPVQTIVFMDLVQYSHLEAYVNIWVILFIISIAYMFHRLYFGMSRRIFKGIKSLSDNNPQELFFWPYQYKGRCPVKQVKKATKKYFLFCYAFILGQGLYSELIDVVFGNIV